MTAQQWFANVRGRGYQVVADGVTAYHPGRHLISLRHPNPPSGQPEELWGMGDTRERAIEDMFDRFGG